MNIFRSLSSKLFFIAGISLIVALLPCLYTSSIFSGRIDKCKSQMKAVELLGCVAELTNEMYAKEYNLQAFNKDKMHSAANELAQYYEKFSENNAKVGSLFSKTSLSNFQQKKLRSNMVSDMSALITERASLFSDSRTGIRILMEATGSSIPSIVTDLIVYRSLLTSSEKGDGTLANVFSRLSFQTRSMIFKLGKTSSEGDFRIAPEIYEKTNRLKLQVWKIERLLAAQSQEVRLSQIAGDVDLFETILFDIWGAVNKNLDDMLRAKLAERENQFIFFWSVVVVVLIVTIVLVLLISRSVLRGLFNISEVVKLAANGNISSAKDLLENNFSKKAGFGELNDNVFLLINYISELIEISTSIAKVSNKINLMLRGLGATKMQLFVSIKDSFGEINKQIRSDYDFVLQETAILSECSELTLEIERNLKTSKKICANLSENISAISGISNSISKNLHESSALFEKISSTINAFSDAAEKINLLGLNLSIIAQKLGASSEGAETISSQIRSVSRQMAVSVVDVDALSASLSQLIVQAQADNSKIGEVAELSKSSSKEVDVLSDKSWRENSDVGENIASVVASLKAGISSGFDGNVSIQNLDDIRDSIKDIAVIVKKSTENIEHFRAKIRGLSSKQ